MSDLTKVHSTTSSLPFIASNSDDVNLAPAYAIDSVAEPYNDHQKQSITFTYIKDLE